MVTSSQISQLLFPGNGSTSTPYPLTNLRFDENAWLVVVEIAEDGVITLLDEGADYTVMGSGAASSASVVTGVRAIPVSSQLRVTRNTPRTQEADFTANGAIPSATLERRLDWLTMQNIDLKRDLDALPVLNIADAVEASESAALAASLAAGVAEEAATLAVTNRFPPGPYVDDKDAFNHQVPVDSMYRKAAGVLAWRQKLVIGKVAMGPGDSQTAFGAATLIETGAYWGWLRFMLGSRLDIVSDTAAGKIPFATGGHKISQFGVHVTALIATLPGSQIKYAWVMGGTNDALANVEPAQSALDMRNVVCAPLKDAGIVPLVFAPYPMPLAVLTGGSGEDNMTGIYSARIVALRAALAAMCAAEGIPYYDLNSSIELSPGVANPAMMNDDGNVHLGPYGAAIFARVAAVQVSADFDLSEVDPLNNVDYITPNANFSAISGGVNPTGYFFSPGGSITPSIVTDGDGTWWRLQVTAGTAVTLWHPGQNTEGDPAGLDVDGILRLRVQAGELKHTRFMITPILNGASRSSDATSVAARAAVILPVDGIKIFRTPIVTIGADANIIPQWNFTAGAAGVTVDIQLPTVRLYP
ncbi:SGNH/GDSL hydrolase family protein [Luteolibacter sp. Populi]|uniref:SGNH/GDSL hydrolase family protein n=1 Tax=Luteolibacter sp. Populi TaxID=3230487 RepID=UPI0034652F66